MNLDAEAIGVAIGAEVLAEGEPSSPSRATIDSGASGPGDLFFGLRGERVDGGDFAPAALEAGAWGAVVGRPARERFAADERREHDLGGWVFAVDDPLVALQSLARAYRRALGARVLGVTGSVGKTSVKDIARALLPGRVHANS